jgi:hypothetical protein
MRQVLRRCAEAAVDGIVVLIGNPSSGSSPVQTRRQSREIGWPGGLEAELGGGS